MKLPHTFSYFLRLKKRFGIRAVWFLIKSKMRTRPSEEIIINGIKHPVTLSNFNVDVTTLFQIFFAEEYYIDFPEPPETIVDCGANIGLSAVYFANKFPNATIIAIEPDSQNFEFLKKNTTPYKNIHCLQRAVWPTSVQMEVVDPGNGGWSLQTKASETGTMKSITLDEVMQQFDFSTIDLLKIDIEGAEKELFESHYEHWLAKTGTIAIELHDFLQPGTSDNFYQAVAPFHFKMSPKGENLICQK